VGFHISEWLFIRIAPFALIGAIVGASDQEKKYETALLLPLPAFIPFNALFDWRQAVDLQYFQPDTQKKS